jgi:hypothetical protein
MQRYVMHSTYGLLAISPLFCCYIVVTLSEPGVGDGTGGIYFYPLGSVRERGHCMDC